MNRRIESLDDVECREDLYRLKKRKITKEQRIEKAARFLDRDFGNGRGPFSNYWKNSNKG